MEHDIQLMLQSKEDNLAAFEELYRKYQRPIENFFFRLGCDYESAEDYTQEVFLRLWKTRKNYEPVARFTTFLFEIAKNYWLNERDKRKRRPPTQSLNLPSEEKVGDMSPDQVFLSRELEEKIQEAIIALPTKYRLVFVLSEVSGMKYKEIAEVLGIPVGTVKSRMFIAERKLRKKIIRYLE